MAVQENFTEKYRVARNYKIIRQFKGKTPAEIAEETGISKQNLSTWENEKGNPGTPFIDQLSKYFGLPREVFFKEDLTLEYLQSLRNLTPVQDGSDNTANTIKDNNEIFQKVVRVGTTEYVVMPKTTLDGEYRIMPKAELDKFERQFDKIDERTQVALSAKDEVIQMKDELLKDREQRLKEREEIILSLRKQLTEMSQKTQ